jgi:hypothetical protein
MLALFGLAAPAGAATFCVNSAATLKTALSTAATNGADDEVHIVQGTYVGNFVYASTQVNKLSVLGGYTAGCASRVLNPVNTILDGNQTNTVLVLSAPDLAAAFLVEGLTLRNGKRTTDDGYGGGLYANSDGTVMVKRNRIENNKVTAFFSYGGGACIEATTATLTDNSITGNTSTYGGGVYLGATTATLTNNSITGNTASYGGGTSIRYAHTAALTNNSIKNNTGRNQGGGVEILHGDIVTLANNSITGNTSADGGGAYIDYGFYFGTSTATLRLTNNSIVGNSADLGGGLNLRLTDSETALSATLYNNLFLDNVADENNGADIEIENDGDGDYLPTPVTLRANNFDQTPIGFAITLPITIPPGNLNGVDPLFANQAAGDLHLRAGSPMIDAGYPATPDLPATDLGGGPRLLGAAVDIGAYEFNDGSGTPDFQVSAMVLTPGSPFANTSFSAAITVRNRGTLAGVPGTLQVWANQSAQPPCGALGHKSVTLTSLAPGTTRTVTVSGLAAGASGSKTLRAFVDSKCQARELDETNNQLAKTYTVKPPAPDFLVTSMVVSPGNPLARGTFNLAVTVKNQGAVSGDGGYLDVWVNQPTVQTCGADGNDYASIGTLAANATKTLTFSGLRAGAAGAKTLRAYVDSWCDTTESTEANNQAVKQVTVIIP